MADNTAKTVAVGGLFAALLGGAALLLGKKSAPKLGSAAPPRIRKGCNCGR
jgi:hypothetical protein